MSYDAKAHDDLNRLHSEQPAIGDYWHDMFSPVAVVIDVTPFFVACIEKTKSTDADHWTWDLDAQPSLYTRRAYRWRWTYGRCGNDLFEGIDPDPGVKNKCWATVVPERHKWVREELEKAGAA